MKNQFKIFLFFALAVFAFASCEDDDPANVVACFTVTPEEGIQVGDTVFFDNCSEEALNFTWDFGDSETSTEIHPFHIYSEPGVYDVTLVAANVDVEETAAYQVNVDADLAYIVNAGNWGEGHSTISAFNKYDDELTNEYYKSINSIDMISNVQHAYKYNGNIYMMGNGADQIFWVDAKTFEQTENGITEDIVGPRFCQGKGDYLYVSCWGGNIWADESLSYIAKINLTTNSVEKKISLPGGPEGMAISNNKLYAALNYKDSVAIIDLDSEAISYIQTEAVSSYFLKDNNDNLYVSFVSTWSDPSESAGLGYINTATDELEGTYPLTGITTSYVNVFAANDDFTKLYVSKGEYYFGTGSIAVFDVATKSFEAENLVDDVTSINGVDFYDDKVFCFISPNVTSNGKVVTYSTDGTKISEYETGIAPFMILE